MEELLEMIDVEEFMYYWALNLDGRTRFDLQIW